VSINVSQSLSKRHIGLLNVYCEKCHRAICNYT